VSSILKALQRVEQERPAGAAPNAPRRALRGDLVAEKGQPLLRRPRRQHRRVNLPLWGTLGAIVLLAGLVWWRLPERTRPAVVAAAPEAGEVVPEAAQAAPEAGKAARAARPRPPPAAETAAAVAAQAAPAAEPAPAPQAAVPVEVAERLPPIGSTLEPPEPAPVQEAPPPAPPPAPMQEAPAPAPPPAPLAAAEPAPAPKPARAKPSAPAVEPVKPVARAERAPARPAPVVAKPAPPPAPSAPAVLVERTSWHPSAERRVAWVSVEGISGTRELHEGDAVGALVVKEIRPSAVVFLHGPDTLQRKVGQRE
jgi:hypothetical protein